MIGLLVAAEASAQALPSTGSQLEALVAPITEIDHPTYADGAGTPLAWRDVRDLASNTDAVRRVRGRRLGRTVLRFTFAAATAVEVWGTYELARRDNEALAGVLGAQAGLTGLAEVLMFTGIPGWRVEDRAILLSGANGWVRTSQP